MRQSTEHTGGVRLPILKVRAHQTLIFRYLASPFFHGKNFKSGAKNTSKVVLTKEKERYVESVWVKEWRSERVRRFIPMNYKQCWSSKLMKAFDYYMYKKHQLDLWVTTGLNEWQSWRLWGWLEFWVTKKLNIVEFKKKVVICTLIHD